MIINMKKKLRGSLTVEASLVFPLVIITLLFIANILNICMVHLCMQQALNNTAKKISQNSYMIYRFSSEMDYSEFINSLNDVNDLNSENTFTISKFDELQDSTIDSLKSLDTATHSFDGVSITNLFEKLKLFAKNVNNLMLNFTKTINTFKDFTMNVNNLIEKGKNSIQDAVLDLMLDSGDSVTINSAYEYLFKKYIEELSVPASRIEDLKFYPVVYSADNDGKYKLVVSYYYHNPFSLFVNNQSAEYSVINNKIKMINVVSIRPFIGKMGTSFRDIPEDEEDNYGSSPITVGVGDEGGGGGGVR